MDLPLLLLQDDLCSGELLKWTPRVNRTCMYSRRPETLILVLQHWTCWRWMISTPHSQHRLSVQTHLAILNQPLLQRSCHNTRDTFYGKHLKAQTDILFFFIDVLFFSDAFDSNKAFFSLQFFSD